MRNQALLASMHAGEASLHLLLLLPPLRQVGQPHECNSA